ncbi:MAG: hypothetical protein IPK78_20065 [Rhodospirillales bacterium]|nr:hypothetical protein [Rhodospirillales bacterium]
MLPVANHTPTWTVAGVAAGTTSFTLEARGPGSDLGQPPHQPKWTIKVDDVVQPPTGKKTFTLKVEWTNTVTVEAGDLGVDPDTSGSKLFPLAFATTITKPDGTNLKLPRPGAVTLRGGAEAAEATKAKATLLANA